MTLTDFPVDELATPAERIRWARTRKGLSQERLAEIVGTSRRHMIRLENGENIPGLKLRTRIAEATDTTPEFLKDGADGG